MARPIPVFCACGKVVPAYHYCHRCRQVNGEPNCPCGRPLHPVKVWECDVCNPAEGERIRLNIVREYEHHAGRSCQTGDCEIPTCRTCYRNDFPMVRCEVCHLEHCSKCARICRRTVQEKSKKTDLTVTYSGTGPKYKKGADKDRPKMFVESWYYKGGRLVNRTLVGFEKKEA